MNIQYFILSSLSLQKLGVRLVVKNSVTVWYRGSPDPPPSPSLTLLLNWNQINGKRIHCSGVGSQSAPLPPHSLTLLLHCCWARGEKKIHWSGVGRGDRSAVCTPIPLPWACHCCIIKIKALEVCSYQFLAVHFSFPYLSVILPWYVVLVLYLMAVLRLLRG